MKRLVTLALTALVLCSAGPAESVELKFQTGKSANLFWMVDQLSQWDARHTSPAYREYWEKKLTLTDEDYAILDQYARLRLRLARLDDSKVQRETSPWVSLFGGATILPHERFVLAFLETRTPKDAVILLKLSQRDQKVIIGTLIHFAKKLKDQFGTETAHLSSFAQKARILITLADAGGFIGEMKSFFGIQGPLPQTIPVDVLWAPPGFVNPTHMGYHILLPVSVDKAESDEAVLQHLSMAIQEVGQYLLTKLPEETLTQASRAVLRECGHVNPGQPDMVRRALQVALGEMLFLRERFPDLPQSAVLEPWQPNLEFPFAVDELARAYAGELKQVFSQAGGFYPGFVGKAIDIQQKLFPPRPRYFASTGLILGDKEGLEMFDGLFPSVDRKGFSIDQPDSLIEAHKAEPDRTVFIVVTAANASNMYHVLKRITDWRHLTRSFRGLKKSSYVYPITTRGKGSIFVIHGQDHAAVRKALVNLHTMGSMPTKAVVVQ